MDGIGIGKNDPEANPFIKYNYKFLSETFSTIPTLENQYLESENRFLFPVDANLGVEGLPQSGTGQTAIFCGVNAPKIVGKHFGPYPYSTLIPIIEMDNIFRYYRDRGKKSFFANAYPKIFFDYIKTKKGRLSVTSLSCLLSGIKLNGPTAVRNGKALTAEIDNKRWVEKLDYKLPVIKPETAAKRLLQITEENNLTVYEFFLTDHFGHGRSMEIFERTMGVFDKFMCYILNNISSNISLIVCSDHGNFEDISIKTHTRNPALTISAGRGAKFLSEKIKDLTDLKLALWENDS